MTAVLRELLGQGDDWRRLLRLARRRQMHHGVLVEGAPGIGKSTALTYLTAALLCADDGHSLLGPDLPCGVCGPCRRVAAGNHADLHLLTVPEDKNLIPVDDVREVQEALLRTPTEGRARVLCIDPADRLNEQGQNALLKTLEEPGQNRWLLLACARPEGMLPTVRSRVQRLRLRPLSRDLLRQEFSRAGEVVDARAERAFGLCDGSLGLARALCTEQAVQLHDLVHEVLADTDRLRAVATARAVTTAADRQGSLARVRTFLLLLRSELRARLHGLLESGPGPAYAAAAADRWTALVECTIRAEEDLELQIPPEQVLSGCLLRMQATG